METGVLSRVEQLDMSTLYTTARAVYRALSSCIKSNMPVPRFGTTDALEIELQRLDTHTLSGQRWPRLITAVTGWVAELWANDPHGTVTRVRGRWGTGRLTTPSKFAHPYTRLQIDSKGLPGLTARAAQIVIKGGKPVVTKDRIKGALTKEVNRLQKDQDFLSYFGGKIETSSSRPRGRDRWPLRSPRRE
jgi:hypothetical protein